jgi:hypothetical protein
MSAGRRMDASLVSQAIVIWTGWGQATWPVRDEARVVKRFGVDTAADLLPRIRELAREFYSSDARDVIADLKEMGDVAAGEFRRAHPELSDEAVQALVWCYTYDNK